MSKSELLDRDSEVNKLSNIINQENTCNSIIIITGISGVGKSGLIEKLKASNKIQSLIVNVKMSKTSSSTIENLQYFNSIYKSLEEFSMKNSSLIKTPVQYGFSSIGNLVKYFFSLYRSKRGYGDAISIFESSEDETIIRKKDYIIYTLNKSNIILDIENIQNIDTQSFEILKEIINGVDNKFFIFEYTLGEKDKSHFDNFYKEVKETNSNISNFLVEKMDYIYAKQLAPKDSNVNLSVLERVYDESNGNLMEIILSNEKTSLDKSNITQSINDLFDDEKYIIYSIYLNGGYIDENLLMYLLTKESKINKAFNINLFNKVIKKLISKKILVYRAESILSLKHDSIISELDKLKYDPILYVAYANIKDYYMLQLAENPTNNNIIEKLLELFLKFSDEELFSILPNIQTLIRNIKYPQLIVIELEKYRKKILETYAFNRKSIYSLSIFLTEICLSNKLVYNAQKNLDIIFDDSNEYHLALQGQIYSLQENINAEEKLKQLITKSENNSRLKLILELCLMCYYMKMNNTDISRECGNSIIKNPEYKKYKEYGYALRNYAELCDSNQQCLNLYNNAIKIFANYNMYFDIACVYISLSMIYSYQGQLKKARKFIKKAIKIAPKTISQCYILNNSAVIDILDNKYNLDTEKQLEDAALLSVTEYERLIIFCNLIVYYCLNNNLEKASSYVENVEKSDYRRFQYEELIHIVLQNLLFYYKCAFNVEKSEYYSTKILELINDPKTRNSTKELAKSMNGYTTSDSFYSKLSYRVDFLGYWEFNIDSDLDHFE